MRRRAYLATSTRPSLAMEEPESLDLAKLQDCLWKRLGDRLNPGSNFAVPTYDRWIEILDTMRQEEREKLRDYGESEAERRRKRKSMQRCSQRWQKRNLRERDGQLGVEGKHENGKLIFKLYLHRDQVYKRLVHLYDSGFKTKKGLRIEVGRRFTNVAQVRSSVICFCFNKISVRGFWYC